MTNRLHVAAALTAALVSTAALAGPDYSPSKKGQYPSPNLNRADVDTLVVRGQNSTGEIPGMTVGGQPLSGLLSAAPQIVDGRLQFLNGPTLGTIGPGGKFTLTPDAVTAPSLTLTGPGLSGPIDSGTVGGTAIPAILGSKAPLASPTFSGTVTAPGLSLNGSGLAGPIDNGTVRGDALAAVIAGNVPNVAALKAVPVTSLASGIVAQLSGYAAASDSGGGPVVWSPASTAVEDGCTVFKPTGTAGPGRWLRQVRSGSIPVEWCGALGQGDDTAALAAALAVTGSIQLRGGVTYSVTNLVLPSIPPSGEFPRANVVAVGGKATIKKLLGGDNAYLAASQYWVNNQNYADLPIYIKDVVFDGNNIAQDALTITNYNAVVDGVLGMHATRDGIVIPDVTRNGTALSNNISNPAIKNSQASFNGGKGLRSGTKIADLQIIGGYYHDNGGSAGDYQVYAANAAGMQMVGATTYPDYNSTSRLGAYFENYGDNTNVASNNLDGLVVVHTVSTTALIGRMTGNGFTTGLKVNFGNVAGTTAFVSQSNHFMADAKLTHASNTPNARLISQGDTFTDAAPFAFSAPSGMNTLGTIEARNVYSRGLLSTVNGIYTSSDAVLPEVIRLSKSLSNGTSTTITASFVLSKDATATAEMTIDILGYESNASYTAFDAISGQVVAAATRQFQDARGGAAATVTRTTTSNSGVTIAASASRTGGAADQTVTVTITITHPAPSYDAGPLDIRARVRGTGIKTAALL